MTNKTKATPNNTHTFEEEPRGIIQSIRMFFSSAADTLIFFTNALSTGSKSLDAVARTGLVMAESNERLVIIKTSGKEQYELERIRAKYADIDINL